jgi:hypothetical protein
MVLTVAAAAASGKPRLMAKVAARAAALMIWRMVFFLSVMAMGPGSADAPSLQATGHSLGAQHAEPLRAASCAGPPLHSRAGPHAGLWGFCPGYPACP